MYKKYNTHNIIYKTHKKSLYIRIIGKNVEILH